MKKSLLVAVGLLALALAACTGVRAEIRARPAPASTGFDARELVDVLPPGTVPAIDRPFFESPEASAERLEPADPVVILELGGQARAYPLAILVWHEIVNDEVGGIPVAVTYAPLTDSVAAFDRTASGKVRTFAGSGKLYRSNLVMYDRATKSLWPQLRGAAVLGPLAGAELRRVPVEVSSFGAFLKAYPGGTVLTAETGAARVYGATPYDGYDSRPSPSDSFFFPAVDERLGAMERVVGVAAGTEARAYPHAALRDAGGVVADRIGGGAVVVLWQRGVRSVLDTPLIADARDVGSTGVFVPEVDGRPLDFEPVQNGFRDRQTGSTWSVLGMATAGPLKGARLAPVPHVDAFWFAWAAFTPQTTVFGAAR